MKIELDLNHTQHDLLMWLAADDCKPRSLQSFATSLFVDAMVRQAAECPPARRRAAVDALVGAINASRRNTGKPHATR